MQKFDDSTLLNHNTLYSYIIKKIREANSIEVQIHGLNKR
jgi:hypothetical protein